jgi:tellurite resistance protein
MARWSKAVEGSVFHVEKAGLKGHFLKQYYESQAYVPETEEDKKELEDFSFIISIMSLLVHLAKADGAIEHEEKKRIIDELVFQLEHRFYEYEILSKKFGESDLEIVSNIFAKLLEDYEKDNLNLNETLKIIKKIYNFNPYKLKFVLHLCYIVALSDEVITPSEHIVIQQFAEAFDIPKIELERIEAEAYRQLKLNYS